MPTLTIDGKEVTVADGTNLVEAAKSIGIEIPTFCYHKHLSIAANCRMCLVKGSQGGRAWPKPMPACQMIVFDGMEIDASSDEVKKLRKAVLEFILINHPLDCPICDKAGECDLQDNFFKHSNQPSRFAERKEEQPKRVQIGPRIVYDGERCILCTRCVRFMDEVAKDAQLGVIHRGDHSYIATATGKPLEHPYSVNVVDICPVGALTDTEFRFKQRAWFLQATPSICAGCARGCNTYVDVSSVDGKAYRIRPRLNDAVNGPWMCDAGRLTFHELHDNRLTAPRIDGTLNSDIPGACAAAIEKLKPFFGADELAVAVSANVSCEDAFAVGLLASTLLDAGRVCIIGREDWDADDFLKLADNNPNRRGVKEVLEGLELELSRPEALLSSIESGETKALLLVGNTWPFDRDRVAGALKKLEALVALLPQDDAVAKVATVALPIANWAEGEGCFVNALGRVQKLKAAMPPSGQARPIWELVQAMARTADQQLRFRSIAEVFGRMVERVSFFGNLTFDKIPQEGTARDEETLAPRFVGDQGSSE